MPELKISSVSFKKLCCFTVEKRWSVLGVGSKVLAAAREAAGVASVGRDHVGHSQFQSALKWKETHFRPHGIIIRVMKVF